MDVKGYYVTFEKSRNGWRWFIVYKNNIIALMPPGKFYTSKTNCVHAFWKLFSNKTLEQIEENYATNS